MASLQWQSQRRRLERQIYGGGRRGGDLSSEFTAAVGDAGTAIQSSWFENKKKNDTQKWKPQSARAEHVH